MDNQFKQCESILSDWLQKAFAAAFSGHQVDWSAVEVHRATDTSFGDFQCNDAMRFGKALKMPPRGVAEAALSAIPLPPMVTKATIAGPGFINLEVSNTWLAEQLDTMLASPATGIPQTGAGGTVILDYSSPNIAKPMHIGHIRSTVIGSAIDRLYRAIGYKVISDNHLGDWGTQFGILIKGYREFLTEAEQQNLTIELLEQAYVRSYAFTQENPEWLEECKAELVKLQQGDQQNLQTWQEFINISMQEFNRIYHRLDVSFDLTRGESYYNDMLPGIIDVLKERGLATPSEGALIVDLESEKMPVCIVQKSDGAFNYATTDIATIHNRVEEFDPEKIIYVTDERQQLHFRQIFTICQKLGYTCKLEHLWFGLMRLPEGTFSTRQGNVIKLEALLDEAENRALEIIRTSNPEMPAAEQKELATAIGIGAIKYTDLSHDPQTMIVFTWDKALALDGNSGPYLQYAYARICSMLDKYAQLVSENTPLDNTLKLCEIQERTLALHLLAFPATVQRAAQTLKPSVLAEYLFSLAQIYSSFYQRYPVLKSEPEIRDSRIKLCAITAEILAQGLHLLGLKTPRRI